ncbi:replication restart helicase PriA [Candidatus Phytoplasma solani]|uniref:replication restart helicase PriA n=1 Tax=Candidatus Phytoplasma solani TaxID=69896 RepID=UPI0003B7BE13|nr:primosomal protein N' [Candidatus Phytoplasma solani]CCP88028.1 Primosomal protein N' [Candidatus Phytoplasma solani]
MIAQVIIDLKTSSLNRCFDYLIPENLLSLAQKGMRVVVPFGAKNLYRLGYIIDIQLTSQFANKELIDILDEQPYFNEELFLLADNMLQNPFSLKALVYQTIMPKSFLITHLKEITIIKPQLIPKNIKINFPKKNKFLVNANHKMMSSLQVLSQQGIIFIKDISKTRKIEKNTLFYVLNVELQELQSLKLTPKQEAFIKILVNYQNKTILFETFIDRKEALRWTSESIIQALIKKKIIVPTLKKTDVVLEHHFTPLKQDKKITLKEKQQQVLKSIRFNQYQTYLLHGKTGSGKTEIYLNLIEQVLKMQQQVLLIVPEVMLIASLLQRLEAKFDKEKIAVFHSYLSPLQKQTQFNKIKTQTAQIVLGTRSAIFASLNHLGIIIIDEEHDDSLIEKNQAPYDTKELAQIRANYHRIPLILGSATPSLESYYQVLQKKYQLLKLTKRALIGTLPRIKLIDMKEELKNGNLEPFSITLKTALEQTLARGEQAILFINTKGFSPFVLCRFCGNVPKCQNCDSSLTYYRQKQILKCNYCSYQKAFTNQCSNCCKKAVKPLGVGIEYIENHLQKHFKHAKIIKFDSDNVTKLTQYERLWNDFQEHKADILLGTQMITKGLDFHQVTLVGILMADALLKIPSFKASEKTFQLLLQAAGRCARKKEGQVIVQSYNSDHFAIKKAVIYDEDNFVKQLLQERLISQTSPFGYLSKILITHSNFKKVFDVAHQIKDILETTICHPKIKVLGPVLSMMPKKNNRYRVLLTLKYNHWPLNLEFITTQKIHQDCLLFFDRFADLL